MTATVSSRLPSSSTSSIMMNFTKFLTPSPSSPSSTDVIEEFITTATTTSTNTISSMMTTTTIPTTTIESSTTNLMNDLNFQQQQQEQLQLQLEQEEQQKLINQILTTSLRNAIEHNCTDMIFDDETNESTAAFLESAIKSLIYHQNHNGTNDDNNTITDYNNNINNKLEWFLKQTFNNDYYNINQNNHHNDNGNHNKTIASPLSNYSSSTTSSTSTLLYNSIMNVASAISGGSGGNSQKFETDSNSSIKSQPSYCPSAWDGLSCWYRTKPGKQAIIPCFNKFRNITYDTNQNATRLCLPNGTWAESANYSQCKALTNGIEIPMESLFTTNIYYFGYGLSLIGLTIALFIFAYFKDLRCRRNTIHTNLMITYLLIALCWIITDRLHADPSPASQKASCITVIILTYLMITNFSWMFVEGLYLYILVVKTFSIEFVKITNYLLIGWLSPGIIILFWSLVKLYFSNYDSKLVQCPYQAQDEFDYIYRVPILLVLIVNIFFLGKIMWVLIIKLRQSNSIQSKQYRKAAKALLVLIPLLGVGYMLVLVTPTHPTAKLIFQYLQAILVSTQGFTVAVLYCFCNGDVRNSLRLHFQRFRSRYGGVDNIGNGGYNGGKKSKKNLKRNRSRYSTDTTTFLSPPSITNTTMEAPVNNINSNSNNNNGNGNGNGSIVVTIDPKFKKTPNPNGTTTTGNGSKMQIPNNTTNTNKNNGGYHSVSTIPDDEEDDDIVDVVDVDDDEDDYEDEDLIEMQPL